MGWTFGSSMSQSLLPYLRYGRFLAVQWSDAAGVCNLPQEYDEQYVQMGGSTQRGDPQDIEPMVYFAMDKFMSLGA